LLLVTTHGRPYLSELSPELQDVFEDGGLAVRSAQAVGSNDCGAFHPEDVVRTELAPAAGFFVMDFVEEGATGNPHQDVFLLQRADDEAARYLELMARITSRLHRQISRLATERKSATALTELRGYVERIHSSRGWRLLQALRGLGGRRW